MPATKIIFLVLDSKTLKDNGTNVLVAIESLLEYKFSGSSIFQIFSEIFIKFIVGKRLWYLYKKFILAITTS